MRRNGPCYACTWNLSAGSADSTVARRRFPVLRVLLTRRRWTGPVGEERRQYGGAVAFPPYCACSSRAEWRGF